MIAVMQPKPMVPQLDRGHPLSRGLLGYWALTERSGAMTADATRQHDGTNADPDWQIGRYGPEIVGAVLDGVDVGEFHVGAAFTATVLVNQNATIGSHNWIMRYGDSGSYSWRFYQSSGIVVVRMSANGTSASIYTSDGGVISAGVWYAASLVYDGSYLRIYLDGSELVSGAFPQSYSDEPYDAVGQSVEFAKTNAKVAMAAVHDRALTASEVAQLHNDLFAPVRRRPLPVSWLVPTPTGDVTVTASMSGSAALTAAGAARIAASVGMAGLGALTASPSARIAATMAASGSGVLTAVGHQRAAVAATVSGSGAITVTANVRQAATAAVSGSGVLTVAATTTGDVTVTASFSGSGSIEAVANAAIAAAAQMVGSGVIAAAPNQRQAASVQMLAEALLTAVATNTGAAALPAGLTLSVERLGTVAVSVAKAGGLTITVQKEPS
jgi:hypothetical protein